jgi:carbohydrate kinase (thermoresistant glucokinase family)
VSQLLSKELNIPLLEGDDFHPSANIEKMRAGIPLTDSDRIPWLESLHRKIIAALEEGSVVVACSALRQIYRDILQEDIANRSVWVFLHGTEKLIQERLRNRTGHFMPPSLLRTQLNTLEEPKDALVLDISKSTRELTADISAYINRESG